MVCSQAPLSVEFSRQEYFSRLPFPSPGHLPNPGIKSSSTVGSFFTIWATRKYHLLSWATIKMKWNIVHTKPAHFKLPPPLDSQWCCCPWTFLPLKNVYLFANQHSPLKPVLPREGKCSTPQLFLILLAFFFTQVGEIDFNIQHYIHYIILPVFSLYGAFGVCIKKSLPLLRSWR